MKKKRYTLALKSLLFLCYGGFVRVFFFFFFPVSLSHMPSKMNPFFCARTKNCLRVGQGMGRRKSKELTITRILDSCMLYETGGFLLESWELGILLEPHWLKPLFIAPLTALGFARCQDAWNYNTFSPAPEEVTGHWTVDQLPFLSPIHIHPPHPSTQK